LVHWLLLVAIANNSGSNLRALAVHNCLRTAWQRHMHAFDIIFLCRLCMQRCYTEEAEKAQTTRRTSTKRDKDVPEEHGIADTEAPFCTTGECRSIL
jgi:hypothetical protein